jgi:nitrate/TMAO reductase-like tetraheme cytochrome c subunit
MQESGRAMPVDVASPDQKPPVGSRPRSRRWPLLLVGVPILLVILASAGFVGASMLEEHDTFCIACHTVPETTYVNRATAAISNNGAAIPDLATAHYQQAHDKNQSFACIDCHRGDSSLNQRIDTLALGGRDVAVFVLGKADPATEKTTIYQPALPNAACISCHTDTLLTVNGIQTHFHNWLPQTAALVASGQQLVTPTGGGRRFGRLRTVNTSLLCTDCHLAHKSANADPQLKFVVRDITQQACDSCHRDAGERPESIDRLLRERR